MLKKVFSLVSLFFIATLLTACYAKPFLKPRPRPVVAVQNAAGQFVYKAI